MRWVLGLVLSFGLVVTATAEVPQLLHYNGYLTNAAGEAVDCPDPIQCESPVDLSFRIYGSSEGGTPLWEESYPDVPVFSGSFHAVLGTINPVSADLLENPTWLAVKVNDNVEMSPRQKITSAAYALRARTSEQAVEAVNATQLGGVDAAEYTPQAILAPVATQGLSADLADGDDDTLGAMTCGGGMVAKANEAGVWVCANDESGSDDTTLTEAQVDEMVLNNGYAAEADLATAQNALSELQTLVDNIDASTGVDISALQAQIVALETALAAESATRSDGDLVLQGNISAVQADVSALDASLDPIAKSNLSCAEGEMAQLNDGVWGCIGGMNRVTAVQPGACDAASVGKVFFDEGANALRVCDGTSYRKVKLCSEVCPDASGVPCGQAVEDDCGAICGGTGTGLNSVQCNASAVGCGLAVVDGCGNDCAVTGTLFDVAQCPSPETVSCGAAVVDSCGNSCGSTGSQCLSELTPHCNAGLCTGHSLVADGVSSRKWSDGTFATSCNEYRTPPLGYSYSGLTGDGLYTVDPDGAGAIPSFVAHCDMSNSDGGWTLSYVMCQAGGGDARAGGLSFETPIEPGPRPVSSLGYDRVLAMNPNHVRFASDFQPPPGYLFTWVDVTQAHNPLQVLLDGSMSTDNQNICISIGPPQPGSSGAACTMNFQHNNPGTESNDIPTIGCSCAVWHIDGMLWGQIDGLTSYNGVSHLVSTGWSHPPQTPTGCLELWVR